MVRELSVIVPTYNVDKYIEQCLDSIIGQTYANLEIIIIDDASTDSTPKIIKEYAQKDGRIRAFYHEKNMGAGPTRNEGIKIALNRKHPGYITFVDGDDYLHDVHHYADIILTMATSDCDVAYSTATELDAATGHKKPLYSMPGGMNKFICTQIACALLQEDLFNSFIPPWTKIVSKELIRKNNIRFSVGNQFEDVLYHYSVILSAERILQINTRAYYYRSNLPGSLTTQSAAAGEKYFDLFLAWLDIEKFIDQQRSSDKYLTKQFIFKYFLLNLKYWLPKSRPSYQFYKRIKSLMRKYGLTRAHFPKKIRSAYDDLIIYPFWRILKQRIRDAIK